ncbi:MAG: glycosyltransferase family 39 protein [Phycisphaerales bacterium]|nr:glycosyltransferase family 39 protein [Phycisphaerales bacterium]
MTDAAALQSSPIAAIDALLAPSRRLILVAVIIVALLIRAAFFLEIGSGPLIWLHLWSQGDMNHFHRWAEQIAAGDWLSRHVDPPQHAWHLDIAGDHVARHFGDFADLSARGGTPGDPAAASLELWRRWSHHPAFWQDPLYPYLVGLTYAVAGPDPRWVYLWQSLLGVASVVLIYSISRRVFGDTAAVIAVALALACGPILIDELVLLRTSCVLFAGLAIAALTLRAAETNNRWCWLAAGAATGAAILLQSQFQIVAIITIACALWVGRASLRLAAIRAGLFAAGVILLQMPLIARNLAVGLPPLTTPMSGVLALMTATEQGAGAATWSHKHTAKILEETGGRLGPAYVAALRTYPSASGYGMLLFDRVLATWHGYEAPNNHNYYHFLEYSATLRTLPVTFALIAPLSIIGLARGAARLRWAWPLYAVVAMSQLVLLLLYVFARFRVPMIAALIPFAAFGALSLFEWVRLRRFGKLGIGVCCAVMVGAWSFSDLPIPKPPIRFSDVANSFEIYYDPRINAAIEANDIDAAIVEMTEALRHQPAAITSISDPQQPQTVSTRELCRQYAWQYGRLVGLYQRANQPARAAAVAQRGELLWRVSQGDSP